MFFRECSTIPMITRRIDLWLFKLGFDARKDEIEEKIASCETTLEDIKKSKKLPQILGIALSLGNYLNAGSRKGAAYGFKLGTLLKLSSTKSLDNKMTLLDFLVIVISKQLPDCENFAEDFTCIEKAAKIKFDYLSSEVVKFNAGIKNIQAAVKNTKEAEGDLFKPNMEKFLGIACAIGKDFNKRWDKVEKTGTTLVEWFGEDKNKMKTEDLIKLFDKFQMEFHSSLIYMKKKAEEEKKEAEREARKKKEKEEKEKKKQQKPKKKKALVEQVLNDLGSKDTGSLSRMVRERRQKQRGRGLKSKRRGGRRAEKKQEYKQGGGSNVSSL